MKSTKKLIVSALLGLLSFEDVQAISLSSEQMSASFAEAAAHGRHEHRHRHRHHRPARHLHGQELLQ